MGWRWHCRQVCWLCPLLWILDVWFNLQAMENETGLLNEVFYVTKQTCDTWHNSRITVLYKVQCGITPRFRQHQTSMSRRVPEQQHVRNQDAIDTFMQSLLPRTIVDWTNLPSSTVEAVIWQPEETTLFIDYTQPCKYLKIAFNAAMVWSWSLSSLN